MKEEQAQGCATGKAQLQAQAGPHTACPIPCYGAGLSILLRLRIQFLRAVVLGQ